VTVKSPALSTRLTWRHASSSLAMKTALVGLAMTCGALGCDKSPYDLAPVRGKVTLDGKPLSGAKIMFAPIAKGETKKVGKPAFGVLQSAGEFVLGTYEPDDGAVVGEHWVTVIRMSDVPKKQREPGQPKPASSAKPEWQRVLFPQTQSVAESQDNEINIDLTSEIVKRHGEFED
jgi:hypothetical protein